MRSRFGGGQPRRAGLYRTAPSNGPPHAPNGPFGTPERAVRPGAIRPVRAKNGLDGVIFRVVGYPHPRPCGFYSARTHTGVHRCSYRCLGVSIAAGAVPSAATLARSVPVAASDGIEAPEEKECLIPL